MESTGIPWARHLDALKRHTLLILGVALAGSALGLLVARQVQPIYEAQSKIWIDPGGSPQNGPMRTQQLLPASSWNELLRSYAIVDPVVRKLHLNLNHKPADSVFFSTFESLPGLRAGSYVLKIDSARRYTLFAGKDTVIERGTVGDSIGRKLGFGWAPDARFFAPGRVIPFSVSSLRNASSRLIAAVSVTMPEDGQFLTVKLSGSDPVKSARILNVWVEQFVTSAHELKKRHLLEFKSILSEQLRATESQLQAAEVQLERFRVNTITLPSGGSAANLGGGQAGSDPSISGYFLQKDILGDVESKRAALERILANANGGRIDPQALLMLPTILTDAPQLRAAIEELASRQAALRTEKQFLTDANPRVKQLSETIRVLEYETIPEIARNVLLTLRMRERDLNSRVQTGSRELRQIPPRTIEELRLVRQVSAIESLYGVLKARYQEVSLSEAQTRADLSVLDIALPPVRPSSNDAPRLLLLAILASVAIAAGVALLHDQLDPRFRYPEQATHELGLTIAGTVPRLKPSRNGDFQIELLSQVVESFRTLRLAVRYDFPADQPVVLAVSSPSSHDGKSLVAANLAMAFASTGNRTLLIDADMRCGSLHGAFGMQPTPGLVEYLGNGTEMDAVVKATGTDNLFLVPRGTRATNAPELIVSDKMSALIQTARRTFDVVIIDSPPFIAGVDAYALGAAAGSILVVLRQGVSDRKLAGAKLAVVDRLPIRILGAVINGVPSGGMYRYYGTDYYSGGRAAKNVGKLSKTRGLVVGA